MANTPVIPFSETISSRLPDEENDDDYPRPGKMTKLDVRRTGWIRPYQSAHPPRDARESETRALANIARNALRDWGMAPAPRLTGDQFLEALFGIVRYGAEPSIGLKDKTDNTTALDQSPPSMQGKGVLVPDKWQLQDAGDLADKEERFKAAMILHDMGVGKTLQALLVSETNQDPDSDPVLVVAPCALLDQWIDQIQKNVPKARVLDYRDCSNDDYDEKQIQEFDYVVVSYHKVASEWAAATNFKKDQDCRMQGLTYGLRPPNIREKRLAKLENREPKERRVRLMTRMPKEILHGMFWHRLICDEVHRTRRNGALARGLYPIKRLRTLLLTRTPMQNRYSDWFPLIKLARLEPFHGNWPAFKKFFTDDIRDKTWKPMDDARRRIMACMIRAVSLGRQGDSEFNGEKVLPEIEVTRVHHRLQPDDGKAFAHHKEMAGYIEKDCQEDTKYIWDENRPAGVDSDGRTIYTEVKTTVPDGKLRHISTRLHRARQGAAHPLTLMDQLPDLKNPANSNLTKADVKKIQTGWRKKIKAGENWRSTAIDKVLEIVVEHFQKPEAQRGGVVVFSEYSRVLEIVEIGLQNHKDVKKDALRLDGTRTKSEKRTALRLFRKQVNNHHKILLATVRSGGEGLNLPEASCVILLTPSFNPYVDEQALARAVRRGQAHHVFQHIITLDESYDVRLTYMGERKKSNAEGILLDLKPAELEEIRSWNTATFREKV